MISNQPIVFNLQYTPYRPPRNATKEQRARHAHDRAFYDMTAEGQTILDYMTREDKAADAEDADEKVPRAPPENSAPVPSEKRYPTILEYLQKATRVFNGKGMISQEELAEMKKRAAQNKGNIWHGYISFNKQESHKIDTPEKCIAFIKNTFGTFFKAAHLNEDNIDLMCSLHIDRPHHLHIHYSFWEKEPKYRSRDGKSFEYRRRGELDKAAIDNMFVKAGIWVSEQKEDLYLTRNDAIKELRRTLSPAEVQQRRKDICEDLLALARDLPPTGRLAYGSKDMEPFRERIDAITEKLFGSDPKARGADLNFQTELARRRAVIKNICNQPYLFSNRNNEPETVERLAQRYHYTIDDKNIHIVEDIEADYKRRLGNVVLQAARDIKPEILERNIGHERASDSGLKKLIHTSEKRTGKIAKQFLRDFKSMVSTNAERARNRLREIEEELRRQRGEETSGESAREEAYRI